MNQVIKDLVYRKGSQRQVDFIAELGGMNLEEKKFLQLAHEGQTDLFIQEELGLDKKVFSRVEDLVSCKLNIAVFECINGYMDTYHEKYN